MFARSALLGFVLLAVNVAAVPAYYGDSEVSYTTSSAYYEPAYTTSSAYAPAYTTSSAYDPVYTTSSAYEPAYTPSSVYEPAYTTSAAYQPQYTTSEYQPAYTSSMAYGYNSYKKRDYGYEASTTSACDPEETYGYDVDSSDYEPAYEPAYTPAYEPAYTPDPTTAYGYSTSSAYEPAYTPSYDDPYATTTAYDAQETGYEYEPEYTPEEPSYDPSYEEPSYDDSYEEPSYDPSYEEPSYDDSYEEPSYDDSYEEPSYDPSYEEPSYTDYEAEPSYESYGSEDSGYEAEETSDPAGTCNAGTLQCCNEVQNASDVDFSKVYGGSDLEFFSNILRGSNAPVGLTCSPIIADTSGGAQCNQQSVCCDSVHSSGAIAIGCNSFNGGSQSAGIF